MKKFIKDFFHLVKNVRQLESDVENFEDKVLAPIEVNSDSFWSPTMITMSSWYTTDTRFRGITLEEKLDAIIKALKIKIERKEEKSEVIAVLPRKKK